MSIDASSHAVQLVVIGASAGAVDALLKILPALPSSYPLSLLIVVHLPPCGNSNLAELIAAHCRIKVKEAEDKEPICAGTAYIAPPNYHLLVEPDMRLSLSSDEPVHYSRPSIDVLFQSAADACGDSVAGVILTGANADGAIGLHAIADSGGIAIVQSPANAQAPEMPQAALESCPSASALTLPEIATFLTTTIFSAAP